MNQAILATEVFGMLALAIIFYGTWFESKDRSEKGRTFVMLLAAVFFNLFIDAVSYINLDWKNNYWIHFAVTLLAFVVPFVVYTVFLQYIYVHVGKKTTLSTALFRVGMIYCGIGTIASIYYGFIGKLFVLKDGVYYQGEFYEGYLLTYVIILGYTIILVLSHANKIGLHDAMAAIIFMVIPVIFIVLNLFYSEMAFSVSAMSLSMIVVNTMLQAERENSLVTTQAAATARAHTDELTGLNNRLAFSEKVDNFDENCNVGVVFADVNGLKYANDHFGHKAGDKLLRDFTEILLDCFKKNSVFRISGDEFVVILTNVTQKKLDEQAKLLELRIADNEYPIASFGVAYGSSSQISRLIDMAEDEMYTDKKKFYSKYPMYSRG